MNNKQLTEVFAISGAGVAADAMQRAKAAAGDQWAVLRKQFDGGEAVIRLQIDFLGQGRAHLRAFLVGTWHGQAKVLEVHARSIECPLDEMSLLVSLRWPSDALAH